RYEASHDWDCVTKLQQEHTIVHLGTHYNETAEYAHWHIPETHFLEMWGDARAFDGTYSVIQPLIAPLYQAHSAFELLAAFTDKPGVTSYDAVREQVKSIFGGGDTEKNWRKTLNDGLIASTAFAPVAVTSKFSPASMAPAATPKPGELEFIFRPDPTIYDGRFA